MDVQIFKSRSLSTLNFLHNSGIFRKKSQQKIMEKNKTNFDYSYIENLEDGNKFKKLLLENLKNQQKREEIYSRKKLVRKIPNREMKDYFGFQRNEQIKINKVRIKSKEKNKKLQLSLQPKKSQSSLIEKFLRKKLKKQNDQRQKISLLKSHKNNIKEIFISLSKLQKFIPKIVQNNFIYFYEQKNDEYLINFSDKFKRICKMKKFVNLNKVIYYEYKIIEIQFQLQKFQILNKQICQSNSNFCKIISNQFIRNLKTIQSFQQFKNKKNKTKLKTGILLEFEENQSKRNKIWMLLIDHCLEQENLNDKFDPGYYKLFGFNKTLNYKLDLDVMKSRIGKELKKNNPYAGINNNKIQVYSFIQI